MFDKAANCIQKAIMSWRSCQETSRSEWQLVRRYCKDVIVALEACHQQVLAARVEREYQQLKYVWDEAVADGHAPTDRLWDAAEELNATLAALDRFKKHLADSPTPALPSHMDADATCEEQTKPARRKGRRLETNLRLKALLVNRNCQFWQLVTRTVNEDPMAFQEFRDNFGPKAIATRWAIEDGEPFDSPEVNRWNTAIKESNIYKQMIKPLFANPPEVPAGWESISSDKHMWDEVLG